MSPDPTATEEPRDPSVLAAAFSDELWATIVDTITNGHPAVARQIADGYLGQSWLTACAEQVMDDARRQDNPAILDGMRFRAETIHRDAAFLGAIVDNVISTAREDGRIPPVRWRWIFYFRNGVDAPEQEMGRNEFSGPDAEARARVFYNSDNARERTDHIWRIELQRRPDLAWQTVERTEYTEEGPQ
jgi:hypothetical protein